MGHHHEKISASGQDLGGQVLFGRRVRLSGTPRDLLPEELGQCSYEECVDGQIVHYLITDFIVTSRMLPADWSVTKLDCHSRPIFPCLARRRCYCYRHEQLSGRQASPDSRTA